MRTLGEVIKGMRCIECQDADKCSGCPYEDIRKSGAFIGQSCLDVMLLDALYYLKEYRMKYLRVEAQVKACDYTEKRLQEEIAKYVEAVKNCEAAENKYKRLIEETSQNLRTTS